MVAKNDVPALSITIDAPFAPLDKDLAATWRRAAGSLVRVPEGLRALGWMRGAGAHAPWPPEQDPHPGQVAWWASLAAELRHDRWSGCWLTAPTTASRHTWRSTGPRVVATEPDIAGVCAGLGGWWIVQPEVTHALAWGVPAGPRRPRVPVRCRGAAVSIADGQGMLVLADDADAAALTRWLPTAGGAQ